MIHVPFAQEKSLAIILASPVGPDDLRTFGEIIAKRAEEHGPLHVLLKLDDAEHWSLEEKWRELRATLVAEKHIDKLAVVGSGPWVRDLAFVGSIFGSTIIETFEPDGSNGAWQWLHTDTHAYDSYATIPFTLDTSDND
ncbi:MAG: STAS/SEC14 domain-containing protein [Fimbriimonadaceae bacterium]